MSLSREDLGRPTPPDRTLLYLALAGVGAIFFFIVCGALLTTCSTNRKNAACASLCEAKGSRMEFRNTYGCLCANGELIQEPASDDTTVIVQPVVH